MIRVAIQVVGNVEMHSSFDMCDCNAPEAIAAKTLGLVCEWLSKEVIQTDLCEYTVCIGRVPDSNKIVTCIVNKY